uniref:Uncharacterized protein n=1 Tax=Odontella aurita TaxID=265563 RepID=A0A7S4IQ51_9STRA|mmetsp:Transcript_28563/g.84105  ORF Transcript_28563/g.84105 Transcript_28563/m.84105 type:complete len:215 (+) Transcript_28563:298-942(+)
MLVYGVWQNATAAWSLLSGVILVASHLYQIRSANSVPSSLEISFTTSFKSDMSTSKSFSLSHSNIPTRGSIPSILHTSYLVRLVGGESSDGVHSAPHGDAPPPHRAVLPPVESRDAIPGGVGRPSVHRRHGELIVALVLHEGGDGRRRSVRAEDLGSLGILGDDVAELRAEVAGGGDPDVCGGCFKIEILGGRGKGRTESWVGALEARRRVWDG